MHRRITNFVRRFGSKSSGLLFSTLTARGLAYGFAAVATLGGVTAATPATDLITEHSKITLVLRELEKLVDPERIVLDAEELAEWSRSQHSYHTGTVPNAVVYVKSTEEVASILQLCNDARMPVIAHGGGTSLEGHLMPQNGGIILSFETMDQVLKLRPGDMDVTVQPGVKWENLNEFLAPYDLFFAVDPGPGATIGGMVGTGCSGTNAVRHGVMRQSVLNLTVVLPDGTVMQTARRARKTAAGFDLTSLFVSSEGQLGIVTEATLRLQPRPAFTAVAVCDFDTIEDATSAAADMMRAGIQVACIELMDDKMMDAINKASGFAYPVKQTLFVKFTGGASEEVQLCATRAKEVLSKHGCGSFQWTSDEAKAKELWQARKVALWSTRAIQPEASAWITDVCVPLSEMAACIGLAKADINQSSLVATLVGHVGDGNFHTFMLFDPNSPEQLAEARALNRRLVQYAIAHDGTCTGEHGVGMGKLKYLETELGPGNIAVMHMLKQSFDPHGILNPGKMPPLPAVRSGLPTPLPRVSPSALGLSVAGQ